MSTRPSDPAEQQDGGAVGLLSRWSRRKQLAKSENPQPELEREPMPDQPQSAEDQGESDPDDRIDPRTGKRFGDLTDEDMPTLESLMPDSDVSMFMARNISPALRMKALTKIFHSAKYNKICLCAEYAEDYTSFQPLGDVIPHDLKASIAREAQRLRDKLLGQGEDISPEEAQARVWRETKHRRAADEVPRDELEASRWQSHEQRLADEESSDIEQEQDPHDV